MTLYHFAARVLLPRVMKIWRFSFSGTQYVPLTGPLIIAANHVSYLDPVAIGVACPRPISYMAKAELFRLPLLSLILPRVNAYPVERGLRPSTAGAIKKSVQILREGRAIGIFPQGTRVREGEGETKAGVALLASLSGAPVVPAYVWGSKDAMHFHQIKVAFGPPLHLPAGRKATRDEIAKFTQEIMAAIRGLETQIHAN